MSSLLPRREPRQFNSSLVLQSLRLPRVESLDWRVDYVVSSSKLDEVEAPAVNLRLKRDDGTTHTFETSTDQFSVLYSGMPRWFLFAARLHGLFTVEKR